MEINDEILQGKIKIPAFQLIQSELLNELSMNKFAVGDKFYTENYLTSRFRVAKMTVRNALSLLEEKGYISRRQGAGAFVAKVPQKPQRLKISNHCTFGVIPGARGFKEHLPLVKILMNLHEEAHKKGYMLYLGYDDVKPFLEAEVDGIVLLGEISSANIQLLKESAVPVVALLKKYKKQ
ncbi:MAG: GntR family transcriptional regulator, partial [Victivallales bacterium]|nr:GntR family transcriptional regulator [Victivallales bacterium]